MESFSHTQKQDPLVHKLRELTVSSNSRDSTPLSLREDNATFDLSQAKAPVSMVIGAQSPEGDRSPLVSGSPSTSQVSVGSIGHSHVAALLPRHFDLTPVARNTSQPARHSDKEYNLISPEERADHLALPADLSAPHVGPSIPPLKAQRARSVGKPLGAPVFDHAPQQYVPPALPLPAPSRKFYSFTSREQYDEDVKQQPHPLPPRGLRPYQPSRQEDLAIRELPEEELQQIFKPDDAEVEKHHRFLLQTPVPLDERQWSIPSLHRASQLQGSLASLTDCTDEDTIVLPDDDDVSWSSTNLEVGHASILEKLPIMEASATDTFDDDDSDLPVRRKRTKAESAFAWLQSVEADPTVLAEAASSKFLQASIPMDPELLSRRQSLPVFHQREVVDKKEAC